MRKTTQIWMNYADKAVEAHNERIKQKILHSIKEELDTATAEFQIFEFLDVDQLI